MNAIDFRKFIITKVFISKMIRGSTMIILGDDEENRKFLHFTDDVYELIKKAIEDYKGD